MTGDSHSESIFFGSSNQSVGGGEASAIPFTKGNASLPPNLLAEIVAFDLTPNKEKVK